MKNIMKISNNSLLWDAIKAYQYPDLCRRFAAKKEITIESAKRLFEGMKEFLYISIISEEPCSPSHMVDEMWHEFITYTRDYRDFCNVYNKGHIDHIPSDEPALEGYIRTRATAKIVFNELDLLCWPEPSEAALAGKCTCSNKGCSCNCKQADAKYRPNPTLQKVA